MIKAHDKNVINARMTNDTTPSPHTFTTEEKTKQKTSESHASMCVSETQMDLNWEWSRCVCVCVWGWRKSRDGRVLKEMDECEEEKKRKDVSWANIHITNQVSEGLFVEILIQNPGKIRQRRGSQSGESTQRERERAVKGERTHTHTLSQHYNQRFGTNIKRHVQTTLKRWSHFC